MKINRLLLTSFGLGFMRPASGTWGSTPPPAIALLFVWAAGANGFDAQDAWILNGILVLLLVLFSVVTVVGGANAEAEFGKKDPGQVVSDEVAGQAIALLALPWRAMAGWTDFWWNVSLAGTAFFAFRIMDIVKPPPANGLQRLPAGWGILVDDLVAGVYALIVTQLVVRYGWAAVFGG